jgi:hypothetical protein
MSFHMHSFHYSFSSRYYIKDVWWILCTTCLVILDVTLLSSSTSYIFFSGKWRQSWRALYSGGRLACVCIVISSCKVYRGPLLSACPRTHCGYTFVCLMSDIRVLDAVVAAASGLD